MHIQVAASLIKLLALAGVALALLSRTHFWP